MNTIKVLKPDSGPFQNAPRSFRGTAGVIVMLLLTALWHAETFARDPDPASRKKAVSSVAIDREPTLQALNNLLALLTHDQARARLVADLRKLRSRVSARNDASFQHSPQGEPANISLLNAFTEALTSTSEKTPRILRVPIANTINEATKEAQHRLDTAFAKGLIQRFLLTAIPGWLLAIGLAIAVSALPAVRRGRTELAQAVYANPVKTQILRAILARGLWRCLPLLCAMAVLGAWPIVTDMDNPWLWIFLAFSVPFVVADLIWQIANTVLAVMGPDRGWRRVGYAQKRLVPWLSGLAATAVASGMLSTAFVRDVLGGEVADLAALVLDLAIGCFIIAFIARYRLGIRSLVVRRRKPTTKPRPLDLRRRVFSLMSKRWHVLAILFVLAHMAARLLGGDVNFIISPMLLLAAVAMGMITALAIDARLVRHMKRLQRYPFGIARRIQARYLQIARVLVHGILLVLTSLVCFDILGFDVGRWLRSEAGWALVRPLLSILGTLIIGWMVWATLDSFIQNALASVDRHGRLLHHSSRTKTMLPFLRNIIFVALCAIVLITILANLGVNVTPLLAGAGILGLAVGFGSQQLVQDLITGLFILFEDSIAVDDVIDTGDHAGVVEALTIRTVKVRDMDGALHSIPFSEIKALKNRSRDFGVYTIRVTVSYDSHLNQAMEIMRQIGLELQTDPKFGLSILGPLEIWGVDQLASDGAVIMGVIKTRPLQQWSVGREFNLRLKNRFDAAGIAMGVPRLSLVPSPVQAGN